MTPHLEQLETRDNPYASLVGGDLVITGSVYNDVVVVTSLGGNWVRLTENGVRWNFNVWGGDVVFRGGFGHDYFRNDSYLRATAYGDYGNDTLIGGGGIDVLFGGSGGDSLIGREQTDYLYGQDGNDYLSGGYGNDYLSGGYGYDELWSGPGFDRYVYDPWSTGPDFDPWYDIIV